MVIGRQPGASKKSKQEIGLEFQVGAEGVSDDYLNHSLIYANYCKALLGEVGYEAFLQGTSKLDLKKKILEGIKNFPSYTEYMIQKGKRGDFGLSEFLTAKGEKIVNRLDNLTRAIKSLGVVSPQKLDVKRTLELFQEVRVLIREQGKN